MAMTIGAEIHGIDLTKPLKDAAVEEIWQALVDWKVVFFRDQSMDNDAFIAMSRQFGDLTPGHHVYGGHKKWNELYWVAKDRRKTRGSGELLYLPWQGWHTDVTPAINPPKVSILRGEIVPPYGGDTMWTDLNAAYEALSPVMREFIDGLRGVHYYAPKAGIKPNKDYLDQMKDNLIITEHPLVRVHPESGKRVLYISPTFLHEIKGLSPTESTALLDLLKTHAVRPEFTVRFKWEPGSIAMWDNRSTAHMAPRDIWASDFDRDFYRTTLVGDVPVGVDGEESTAIEGKPLVAA
ncbi:MAG TPA: taurine dioxygenase [Rhodospirillaceae bacterium]|nr:taurine dioxygenase [Rhodospirillaceae bacterium]MBL25060.1 taurine dioxygenase [Rhodospirillaceae bacterium]HAA93577.1 taurine dioxygenase [Rhodospirillaceae bacterium]HAT34975.1 taurine dioxygenase [Rhodospirillaceae bacterium]